MNGWELDEERRTGKDLASMKTRRLKCWAELHDVVRHSSLSNEWSVQLGSHSFRCLR
jgi:hypothetical protein